MGTVYLLVTIGVALPKLSEASDIASRIFNGTHSPTFIPYHVKLGKLYTNEGYRYQCGGSLISQVYILTAAHCLESVTEIQVTLGAYNRETIKEENIQISKKFKIRKDFENICHHIPLNDIALIELPQPVNLTSTINIVALPSRNDIGKNYVGKIGTLSGWGDTETGRASDDLKSATLKIVENADCNLTHHNDTALCATGMNGFGQHGDSGGPLVVDDVPIGVYSFFWPNDPHEFVNVSHYLDWIEDNSDVKIK